MMCENNINGRNAANITAINLVIRLLIIRIGYLFFLSFLAQTIQEYIMGSDGLTVSVIRIKL